MNFNSLDYAVFLLVSLFGYWRLREHERGRLWFMFLASCAFYMAWNALYIFLMMAPTTLDFFLALAMARTSSPTRRKWLLTASLVTNLGLLGLFKYYNFFADVSVQACALLGLHFHPRYVDVLLPVGISFYTFQTLSYTIDVYRKRIEATKDFIRFAAFVTFFPQLVAGPIVRAVELLPQLRERPHLRAAQVSDGLFLIALGLIKKMVFADYLAINLVDRVFDDPTAYSSAEMLIGLYGYTMQIFCDFSGYTDVARGSAKLFGLELPENFDRPYAARNPAEFWRRWHMTLSGWLRDYLYFPLGGSHVASPARAYFNLWLTVFLVGLWHGAAWTFVIYGILHATAMVLHRFVHRRSRPVSKSHVTHAFKVFGTLHFVVLSRIFFRAGNLDTAVLVMKQLALVKLGLAQVPSMVWWLLVGGYVAHFTPKGWMELLRVRFAALPALAQGGVLAAVAALLMRAATQDVVPYIYFQF
jgi:alginate O-acetyltransferase complex protein AlgI